MKQRMLIAAAALALALPAAALASQITGTLSAGATGSGSSTLSGTVSTSSSGTLTGTVSSPSSGGGGGGGAAGGGAGSNAIDICPNFAGNQSTLPAGYVLLNGNCVLASSGGAAPGVPNTGGTTGTSAPGVPNTGAGGDATAAELALAASLIGGLGALALRQRVR